MTDLPPTRRPSLAVVRAERQRALELVADPTVRARILDAIRLGTHARPACAAEGIPSAVYDSILGRGRAESQQWHDGLIDEPTPYGAFHDDIEKAIGQSFVAHTKALNEAFANDDFGKERGKWMFRRFGPEFAEASRRDEELPGRVDEREIRALLYAKLGLGTRSVEIDQTADRKAIDTTATEAKP